MFLQQLANGLTVGSLYALVAIGYTMVYGILRLINFAHGDIFMMAMYFGFYCVSIFYLPWYVAFPLVVVLTGALGILTERLAYRPLRTRNAPKISMLISAIGASYLMENLATVIFGGRPKDFPQIPLFTDMIALGGQISILNFELNIPIVRVQRLAFIVPVVTVLMLIGLIYLISHTKNGMAMRAVSKDVETARLMGVNVENTIAFTFCIGSVLAAVGAIFWGLKYPPIIPLIGVMPGIKCFIAAVIGGIGNIKGAALGGLLLGLTEIMIVYALPDLNGYRDAFAFIFLIIILLVKPTGLLGETVAEKV